jgi:cyclophilin family peptidyl-prolyl cis-trans isomerase
VAKQAKRERQRQNREARRAYEEQLARRRRTMRTIRGFAIVAIPVLVIGAVLAATSSGDEEESPAVAAGCRAVKAPAPQDETFPTAPPLTIDPATTYTALVDTSCGSFTIQLAAAQAPQTVNSFVFLAQQGFYDGQQLHRVAKNFVVQGGDPKGDGTGGPGYTLPDEPPLDGYQRGSVAMANSGPGTTGSQFYIVTSDKGAETLSAQKSDTGAYLYSVLGQVTEGFETVEKINSLGSTSDDVAEQQPKATVLVDKITISP